MGIQFRFNGESGIRPHWFSRDSRPAYSGETALAVGGRLYDASTAWCPAAGSYNMKNWVQRPDMMDVMPLISEFRAKRDSINDHHLSILAAIDELMQAAQKQKNREFAGFAHNLKSHEDLEAEVIYPTVILIGSYLQEKFGH